jgi:hypothetical protein
MKGGKSAAKAVVSWTLIQGTCLGCADCVLQIEVEEFNASYPDAFCKVKAGLVLFDV